MKRFALIAVLALGGLIVVGCETADSSTAMPATTQAALGAMETCECGAYKGTDMCCNPDLPTCDGCGMIKGSPGCCK